MIPGSQSNFHLSSNKSTDQRTDFDEPYKPQSDYRGHMDLASDISSTSWGNVVRDSHAPDAPHAAVKDPAIHSGLSPEHQKISSLHTSRPSKRASTATTRAAMSYPRKRAVTACQLCRTRKTKCSNSRPKCTLCTSLGADCIYGDPLDHSSFDPASLLMLERLNQIIERLDNPMGFQSTKSLSNTSLTGHVQQTGLSSNTHESSVYEPGAMDPSDDEYMKIPSSRVTVDTVLMWPIFEGRYPPNFLVEPLFDAAVESDSDDEAEGESRSSKFAGSNLSTGAVEENALRLVEKFLALVHIKNPILDVATLRQYARRVAEEGARWDGKSCLVLVACALGCIAKPYSESYRDSSISALNKGDESMTYAVRDLQTAEQYYRLARKRIGLLGSTIIRSQCYFLFGVYLMYALRPLEAWQSFLQASTSYHVYLKGRMQQLERDSPPFSKKRRLEQRLYWSCFKSECEIRVELALPESSIANIRYPDMFPSPPNEQNAMEEYVDENVASHSDLTSPSSSTITSTQRHHRIYSIDKDQQRSWYYYLTDIALRRIGNRLLNTLYKDNAFDIPIPELLRIATDFETQLEQWKQTLPEMFNYDHSDLGITPTEELSYMVRSRIQENKIWLYLPFLYFAIHHGAEDPYQQLVQPYTQKALEYSSCFIKELSVRHRHHGTWYGMRFCTAAAFAIIATVKCGHVDVPETWPSIIEAQVENLRYWEKESPDIAKARVALQEILSELLAPV